MNTAIKQAKDSIIRSAMFALHNEQGVNIISLRPTYLNMAFDYTYRVVFSVRSELLSDDFFKSLTNGSKERVVIACGGFVLAYKDGLVRKYPDLRSALLYFGESDEPIIWTDDSERVIEILGNENAVTGLKLEPSVPFPDGVEPEDEWGYNDKLDLKQDDQGCYYNPPESYYWHRAMDNAQERGFIVESE